MSLQNRAKNTDFFWIYRTPYHLHLSRVNYEPIQWPIPSWLPSVIRDLTIRQRRRPWKRRWKIDFASFQSISRFNQVAQLLKRREFMLELKRGEREFRQRWWNLSPCRSHSQVNLNLVISRRSCAGKAKQCTKKRDACAELLFYSLNLLLFLTFT